jgi:hypothetical protein
LIKALAENNELKSLTKNEKQKLIEEFQSKLPGVTIMIEKSIEPAAYIETQVVDMDISDDDTVDSNKKIQPQTESNQINNNPLQAKEKWCGPSKEQFNEMLKLRQDKSIDLSFKNHNWHLSEEHFKLKNSPNLNNNDNKESGSDGSNTKKKSD